MTGFNITVVRIYGDFTISVVDPSGYPVLDSVAVTKDYSVFQVAGTGSGSSYFDDKSRFEITVAARAGLTDGQYYISVKKDGQTRIFEGVPITLSLRKG